MKKFLLLFTLSIILLVSAFSTVISAGAEEPLPAEEGEEITTVEEEIAEGEEITEEDFKTQVEAFLSQYFEQDLLAKIIGWAIDTGVLTSLFVIYLKYRKYKKTTMEEVLDAIKTGLTTQFGDSFDKLSKQTINGLISAISRLENAQEVIMKVLVLMQDTTANGKIALIEYLGTKTQNDELKKSAEEVKQEIEQQQATIDEVNNKVSGKYEKIF